MSLDLNPAQRGALFENFKFEIKDKFRHLGSYQKTIITEALHYHFRHGNKIDITETKDFPKKDEKVKQYYVVKCEVNIPGLNESIAMEKKWLKEDLEKL